MRHETENAPAWQCQGARPVDFDIGILPDEQTAVKRIANKLREYIDDIKIANLANLFADAVDHEAIVLRHASEWLSENVPSYLANAAYEAAMRRADHD